MNESRIIGGVAVSLDGDVRPWIQYGTPTVGTAREYAVLHVGQALTIHVTDASPEALAALAASVLELKAWREQQLTGGGS